ncbi:MAG: UDP-N-acetylglucosamine 2-epimerase, partial [Promethearchaeota archaeon]
LEEIQVNASEVPDYVFNVNLDFQKLLMYRIRNILLDYFSLYSKMHERLDHLFTKLSPKVCVIFNEILPMGKLITKICDERKIPSVLVPHSPVALFVGFDKIDTTYVCVNGDNDAKVYKRLGTEEEKIIFTGRPKFDMIFNKYFKNMEQIKKEIYKKFKFNPSKKLLVYASNESQSGILKERIIDSIIDVYLSRNDVELLFKLHPGEKPDSHLSVLKRRKIQIPVIKNINIYEVICAADVIIGRHTTVQVESVIFNKPVINIDYTDKADKYNLIRDGVCLSVTKEEHLKDAVEKVLHDKSYLKEFSKNRKEFLSARFKYFDGLSSKRVITFIENLLS